MKSLHEVASNKPHAARTDFRSISLFGMTTPSAPLGSHSPERNRTIWILLSYVWVLGICPYLFFVLAIGPLNHLQAQDEYKWLWLGLLVGVFSKLCILPVEAVFGHFVPKASDPSFLLPFGLAGTVKIVFFYTMVSLTQLSILERVFLRDPRISSIFRRSAAKGLHYIFSPPFSGRQLSFCAQPRRRLLGQLHFQLRQQQRDRLRRLRVAAHH